jgi:hypothetical protein
MLVSCYSAIVDNSIYIAYACTVIKKIDLWPSVWETQV